MLDQKKSEADFLLALNKALQKAGEETQFCGVKYLLSGAMSALLTKKTNVKSIVSWLSNILI